MQTWPPVYTLFLLKSYARLELGGLGPIGWNGVKLEHSPLCSVSLVLLFY